MRSGCVNLFVNAQLRHQLVSHSAGAILLRVTELLPDPLQGGPDADFEWVELTNVE